MPGTLSRKIYTPSYEQERAEDVLIEGNRLKLAVRPTQKPKKKNKKTVTCNGCATVVGVKLER